MRHAIRLAFLLLSTVAGARLAPAESPHSQYLQPAVVALQTAIDSRVAKTNDQVEGKLLTNWVLGNKKIPAGSRVRGIVVDTNTGSVTVKFTEYQTKHAPATAVNVRILMVSGAQYIAPPPMMLMNQEAEGVADAIQVGNLAARNDAQDRRYYPGPRNQYGIPPRSTLKGVAQVRTLKTGTLRVTGKTGLRIPKGAWFWIVSGGADCLTPSYNQEDRRKPRLSRARSVQSSLDAFR